MRPESIGYAALARLGPGSRDERRAADACVRLAAGACVRRAAGACVRRAPACGNGRRRRVISPTINRHSGARLDEPTHPNGTDPVRTEAFSPAEDPDLGDDAPEPGSNPPPSSREGAGSRPFSGWLIVGLMLSQTHGAVRTGVMVDASPLGAFRRASPRTSLPSGDGRHASTSRMHRRTVRRPAVA